MRKPTKLKKPKKLLKTKPIYRYTIPDWFKALPATGSHGSNAHQKRLWRLVTDYVRERDFKLYGTCAACGVRFSHWKDSQAGHFKAWTVCKGMFKFDVRNLAAICGGCNSFGDGATNYQFGVEMNRRWGEGHTEWIKQENLRHEGENLDTLLLIAYAEEIIEKKKAL
jgi:hypothetical protein